MVAIVTIAKDALFTRKYFWLVAFLLFLFEIALNVAIIQRVAYTEIDWKAYMQEVEGVLIDKDFDYTHLKGDTGPLVYPAGFVWIYSLLHSITNNGTDIRLAQYIFAGLYMAMICIMFAIYKRAKLPNWTLIALVASRRIHSIFVLRLFNDCIAMLFLYASILVLSYIPSTLAASSSPKPRPNNRYLTISLLALACFMFSFAVSIKMNVLLFAPALLLLLCLYNQGSVFSTIPFLSICAGLQILLAIPFLQANAWGYLSRAFEFSRVFFHIWTVNLKFLPEDVFTSKPLALVLLASHLSILIYFMAKKWTRSRSLMSILFPSSSSSSTSSSATPSYKYALYLLFTSNFIGIVFARTLHFQFYVWYYHSLPLLLVCARFPALVSMIYMAIVEVVWNIFPSNTYSSITLQICHFVLLIALLVAPAPSMFEENDAQKDKKSE